MKTPKEIKKGLYACGTDECHGKHTECPYEGDGVCIMNVCGDALAYVQHLENKCNEMLSIMESNKPENRVLTLEKLKKIDDKDDWFFVWIEYNPKWNPNVYWEQVCLRWIDDTDANFVYPGSKDKCEWPLKSYGIMWRCWLHKPTKEEMAQTPWKEANDIARRV